MSSGALIRHLTRIPVGRDEGPAMTGTQRLALYELFAAARCG